MPKYKVQVNVHPNWVSEFQGNTKLCMASAVQEGSSEEAFNVISFTQHKLAPVIIIQWEDNYQIAASKTGFVPGGEVSVGTEIKDIKYKQEFKFNTDWIAEVEDSTRAPANGFLFITPPGNHPNMLAAATVYKEVGQDSNPIYVSGLRGAGQRKLIPVNKVRLWWQESGGPDEGGMIDDWGSYPITLDLTSVQEKSAWYLENGDWSEKKP